MSSDPVMSLGEFLTANEALGLAALLGAGNPTYRALREVNGARREEAKQLLLSAGIGHGDLDRSLAVLHAIAGSKAVSNDLIPVWTMPGNEAAAGALTSEFGTLVAAARQSVTCATYNFQPTSQMWEVLREASDQSEVVVTVYVDGVKGDARRVKERLPRATIYRSGLLPNGKQIVSHAKFIVIDHAVLLVTSANFSFSAENRNIEFGIRIDSPTLSESVESTMFAKHGSLYELVLLP